MLDCQEAKRWLKQAKYTIESIRVDINGGFHSWACFKAHQAAEFSLKAVLRATGLESFGHDLLSFWRRAARICSSLEGKKDCVTYLNKMYIPPRYPDAWAGDSIPYESYSEKDSKDALACAEKIYYAVRECIESACEDTSEEDK